MKETIPVLVFLVHSVVFAYFYFNRGRQLYNLLFFLGFLCLLVFHVHNGWEFFSGEESGADFLGAFSWVGLLLCGVATPLFVVSLVRKRRNRGEDRFSS